MMRCVEQAPHGEQLALIRIHPDLAGQEAVAGTLTQASTGEQVRLGFTALSSAELKHLAELNRRYRAKFEFPCIVALRLHEGRDTVLSEFERRLRNTPEAEFVAALEQIGHIVRGRLDQLIDEGSPKTAASSSIAKSAHRGHELRLDKISHRFGDFTAVRDIDLVVAGGEMVALLGPSGCGKSTLLRIIAGFIGQTEGRVLFDGAPVDHLNANHRGVGIVFQNYALFPHMSVGRNVAYGLEARRWPRDRIGVRVEEMLDLVHMRAFADRLPRQLSGGQQQRIALARCLAIDPKILLLDEPFGALDKNLRLDMQIEVKRLQRDYGITTILVTHDQEEALSMADRIAVMNKGGIEQVAAPTEIYDRPATLFVNQFVGTTNLLAGELIETGAQQCRVRLDGGEVLTAPTIGGLAVGTKVVVAIRPEQLRLVKTGTAGSCTGVIKTVLPLGSQIVYDIEIAGGRAVKVILVRDTSIMTLEPGGTVGVAPSSAESCRVFAA